MDIILIDGKNYCWRHGWTRRMLRASDGFPTGVIYGVLAGLIRLHRHYPDAAFVFCWDGYDTDNSWRHKLAKTYKANRRKPAQQANDIRAKEAATVRQELYMQIPPLRQILSRMGFLQFEVGQLEADDLIGILSRTLSKRVNRVLIYSSDKDFIQLMGKKIFLVRDVDKTKQCRPLKYKEVEKQFGITADSWVKYRSIVGDVSDNIRKPIKGMGPKTALKMLAAGCDPTRKDGHADTKLKSCWKDVRINYKLTKIIRAVDDKRLPAKAKEEIQTIVDAVTRCSLKKLKRSDEGKSKQSYRAVMKILSRYELEQIIEARQNLWKLP